LNALPVPDPEHDSPAHPAHVEQRVPSGHWVSEVHQQGTPAASHVPLGDETFWQLPLEHDHVWATEVAVSQSSLSAAPLPVHAVELVHWLFLSTHLPLAQSESATHRHAVLAALSTGAGVSVVVHEVPEPVLAHATELGGGWHPWPSSDPLPVHPEQLPLCELGMQ
jgi:hypothetical protein